MVFRGMNRLVIDGDDEERGHGQPSPKKQELGPE
jgi:hypothetical protein